MKEINKDQFKLFKINKNKPLQFKRNLLIEKYIENYLSDQNKVSSTNVSRKSISQSKEEKKTNYFIKKKPISQKKISLQDTEETEATTLISNHFNKSNYNISIRNISSNLLPKTRTMSCTNSNFPQQIYSNVILHKKKPENSFSMRSKSNLNSNNSYISKQIDNRQKNRNSNLDFFKQYEKISKSHNDNNHSFMNTFQKKKNISTQIFRNNFHKISSQKISNTKHNRLLSSNIPTMEKTNLGNAMRMLKNININANNNDNNITKIHKEINIEEFLLIAKKF